MEPDFIRYLGTDGTFETRLARWQNRVIAIKTPLPHLHENSDFISCLLDELEFAAELKHANIEAPLWFDGINGARAAFEHTAGTTLGTLHEYCRKDSGFPRWLPHC